MCRLSHLSAYFFSSSCSLLRKSIKQNASPPSGRTREITSSLYYTTVTECHFNCLINHMKKYITTVRKLLSYLYLFPEAIVMSHWHTKKSILIQLSAASPIKKGEDTSNKIETHNKGAEEVWIALSSCSPELNTFSEMCHLNCQRKCCCHPHLAW